MDTLRGPARPAPEERGLPAWHQVPTPRCPGTVTRPRLLFISPVLPSAVGLGRQIRAWQWLQSLARDHAVTLVIDDRHPPSAAVAAEVDHCIALPAAGPLRRVLTRLKRLLPGAALPPGPPLMLPRVLLRRLPPVDVVFVFRLYMWPVAAALLRAQPGLPVWLDLDDRESTTAARQATLARSRGWRLSAWKYDHYAWLAGRAEAALLPRMQRVFVCSELDRSALASAFPPLLPEVVPNRYSGPLQDLPQQRCGRLLFVGSMGYMPNQDAVLWFAQEILPHINRGRSRPLKLHVVGPGLPRWLQIELERLPHVVIEGFMAELVAAYRNADLVICPIRAGGGTRIKILEAVAMGRAVVTTTVGQEGLAFAADEIAVADDVEAFAAIAGALVDDPERRAGMVDRARGRLRRDYWLPPAA